MRETVLYYLCILIPLAVIIALAKTDIISSKLFVVGLMLYLLPYRAYIDTYRLMDKGVISKMEVWKSLIPGWHVKYFRDLYWT